MQNNDSFLLNKSSKLYQFFNALNKSELTSWLVPRDEYTEELKCFTNLCMFLRTSLFVSLFFLFIIVSLIFGISSFDISFKDAISSNNFFLLFWSLFKVSGIILFSLVLIYYCITRLIVKVKDNLPVSEKVIKEPKPKKPNLFLQALKDKHNKICRSFTIKD